MARHRTCFQQFCRSHDLWCGKSDALAGSGRRTRVAAMLIALCDSTILLLCQCLSFCDIGRDPAPYASHASLLSRKLEMLLNAKLMAATLAEKMKVIDFLHH